MTDKTQKCSAGSTDATDAFWLTDLYPDAKELFKHEQVSLTTASKTCIVVLDANVLLLPFEFESASVDEMQKVYATLSESGKLVVPGQAVREFYKHRSRKISLIADAIEGAIKNSKKQIFDKSIPLLEKDADYIKAKELGRELINKGKEVAEKLSIVNQKLKDEVGADQVSVLYRQVLSNCVCDIQLDEKKRNKIINEVARRSRLRIAPGYKDQNKEDGGIGDYLIWETILQEGAKREVHCIFVTEEEKADWWIKRNGSFQPRPELIDEYRRHSKGKSLHLLPLSGLLHLFKANQKVIKQVQELENKKKFRPSYFSIDTKKTNNITKILAEINNFEMTLKLAKSEEKSLVRKLNELHKTKNLKGIAEYKADISNIELELFGVSSLIHRISDSINRKKEELEQYEA